MRPRDKSFEALKTKKISTKKYISRIENTNSQNLIICKISGKCYTYTRTKDSFLNFLLRLSMYLVTKPIAEHSTIVVFVFRGSMGIVLGVPMFYVGAVLFGAPMTELVTQTMTWSVIQSMFVVLPLAAARKFEIHLWKRVYALNDARSVFELCSSWAGIGSIIGAWFGACLIPLDWDEPWQKWPITLIYGGSLGFVVGHVVGYYQIKKRLKKKGGMTFLVPKTMREKI